MIVAFQNGKYTPDIACHRPRGLGPKGTNVIGVGTRLISESQSKANLKVGHPFPKQALKILDQVTERLRRIEQFIKCQMSCFRHPFSAQVSRKGHRHNPVLPIFGQGDPKDSVGNVISKVLDRFQSSKKPFNLALLFRRLGFHVKRLLHAVDTVLEMTFTAGLKNLPHGKTQNGQ